jgi:hypothetical protein
VLEKEEKMKNISNSMVKSQQDLAALDKELSKDAKAFTMFYGKGQVDYINWKI